MSRQDVINAVLGGRVIWCGSCCMVRFLGGQDLVDKEQIIRSGQCQMCGNVSWMRMSVEMLADPRFTGLDAPI